MVFSRQCKWKWFKKELGTVYILSCQCERKYFEKVADSSLHVLMLLFAQMHSCKLSSFHTLLTMASYSFP